MKAPIVCISIGILVTLLNPFPGVGMGQGYPKGINPTQPISPGEIIYSDEDVSSPEANFFSIKRIKYVYEGIIDKSIRLKKTEYTGDNMVGNNQEKNEIIFLPFNDNKQVLLEVSPQTKGLKAVKLTITVTDDSDRITVEESRGAEAAEPEGY